MCLSWNDLADVLQNPPHLDGLSALALGLFFGQPTRCKEGLLVRPISQRSWRRLESRPPRNKLQLAEFLFADTGKGKAFCPASNTDCHRGSGRIVKNKSPGATDRRRNENASAYSQFFSTARFDLHL
jgi:hypothetical protein